MREKDHSRRGRILRVPGEVVRREIAGETILVPIRGRAADMRRMYALNPSAAFVWERIDGARSLEEILDELLAAFAGERETARADVDAFIATALAEGLLEEAP
ncbi:MAG TPA: PqqD family protein [Candidatus Methanoperedens sp.]|nr:PqqD family protein [Candidatus Methanoperedens sp.]